jgi:general secretion pathway protein F
LLTRGLIALSDALRATWPYLIVIIAGGIIAARAALRIDATRRQWHGRLLRMPWLGPLVRGINTSRFASTLAILVGGGVPLLSALASATRVMTNMVMQEAVEHAIERVREGTSLARALGASQVFPLLLIHLVASGEISGKLEQMLERAAQLETRALERRLTVFLTLLEPVMILLMGGIVLMIVLAILLPIIEINQLVR